MKINQSVRLNRMNLNDIKLVKHMIFLIIFNIIVAASLLLTGYYIKRNPHAQFKVTQFDKSEFIEQYGIEISKAFKFAGIFVKV